jgi:hypothetical protein
MLLGDLISRFEDETVAAEALVGLCDLALTASVSAAAARHDVTSGEFVARCVGRFVQEAPNEEWTTLIGLMGRNDNPGAMFLRRAVEFSLSRICDMDSSWEEYN